MVDGSFGHFPPFRRSGEMGPMAPNEGHTTMRVRAELRYRLPIAEARAEIKRRGGGAARAALKPWLP